MKKLLTIPVLMALSPLAQADIQGITGTTGCGADACFALTAKPGHIALGDGNSLLTWGYAKGTDPTGINDSVVMQYPGPTLIVQEGQRVQVTLTNGLVTRSDLSAAVEATSIVFPGQSGVTASGGSPGLLTNEAALGESVTYSFTVDHAGTYMYQSGSHAEVQIEMGLAGAIIVRPANFDPAAPVAYSMEDSSGTKVPNPATAYDREFLFFLTDMDRSAHEGLDGGFPADPNLYAATLWFINGRNGPDTMHVDNAPWLPNQPYGSLVQAKPSDRVLMRLVGGGRDLHPFHHHGNNAWVIAQDGRVLESSAGAAGDYPDFMETGGALTGTASSTNWNWLPDGATLPDESMSNYTITVVPGNTYDAIFTWTGRDLNWDIYGNRPGHTFADCVDWPDNHVRSVTEDWEGPGVSEDPSSHCKDLQVKIPEQQALTFGGLWSGSIFLGTVETLPPGQGGLNPLGGLAFMWHSHTERELTNDDIFPGGMMTMLIVEAPDSALPDPVNIAP